MRSSLPALCVVLIVPAVWAQFTDLTAPGHGDDLYYSLSAAGGGPIYKVGSMPPTLFAWMAPPVFPPNNIYQTNEPWYISPYYRISHPQGSRDGSVFAYLGTRDCLGGLGCYSVATTQTTVQGVPGHGPLTFEGKGWLSGNGRYLLLQADPSPSVLPWAVWVDLQSGVRQTLSFAADFSSPSNSGRVLADDGTAVFSGLFMLRGGQVTQPNPVEQEPAFEPVIDAAAQTVVYTSVAGSKYLRVYFIAAKRDIVLVQANGDTYSPALSADGKRVMFLSTAQWGTNHPPGVAQLYSVNIDGTGFLELTSGSEPSGVQQYAMSDDGQVVWYLTGDGKVVKLNLSASTPVRSAFRPAAVNLSGLLASGSAATMPGVGIKDAKVTLDGSVAPLISVTPSGITFQVPWELRAGKPVTMQVVTNAGTEAESFVQASVTPVASWPSLIRVQGCTLLNICDLGGGAIHQDWSGYVTQEHPALPGELLHFYGTGFGPVSPTPPTGSAGGTNPLAVVPAMPVCTSDPGGPATVTYLGLAPGLVGYYQMDVQLPTAFAAVHPTENKTYPQFSIDCGPGAIAVFAIKTSTP